MRIVITKTVKEVLILTRYGFDAICILPSYLQKKMRRIRRGDFVFTQPEAQIEFTPGWDVRRINGTIFWNMFNPIGVLIKYPCGTKRFIKDVNVDKAIAMSNVH